MELDNVIAAIGRSGSVVGERGLPCCGLKRPLRLHEIAEQALAADAAVETYIASLLTVDRTRPEGRVYLADLAEILALSPLLVRRIHDACDALLTSLTDSAARGRAA